MSQESSSFHLLDERIQRFIWAEGWEGLRDVQEQAGPAGALRRQGRHHCCRDRLGQDRGCLPSSADATASRREGPGPHRLRESAEGAHQRPVWPARQALRATGHSGLALARRHLCHHPRLASWRSAMGVLLITPESLEALLCNRGTSIAGCFRADRLLRGRRTPRIHRLGAWQAVAVADAPHRAASSAAPSRESVCRQRWATCSSRPTSFARQAPRWSWSQRSRGMGSSLSSRGTRSLSCVAPEAKAPRVRTDEDEGGRPPGATGDEVEEDGVPSR